MPNTYKAYAINWTEHERGWGSRPDGHTIYPTLEDARAHIKSYWAHQPDGPAPDEYSAPDAPKQIMITEEQLEKFKDMKYFWGHPTKWI